MKRVVAAVLVVAAGGPGAGAGAGGPAGAGRGRRQQIGRVSGQEPVVRPGPEHERLKQLAGTWDTTMTYGGMASKGTCVYKMEVGGLWLTSAFEGEFAGQKFSGRGLDSYDAGKKKYVGVWV